METTNKTEAIKKIDWQEIPSCNEIKEVQMIHKGWSGEAKYQLTYNNGEKRLLRVSSAKEVDRKQKEFALMKELFDLGISIPQPISLEVSAKEHQVLMLLAWCEGEDAEKVLPTLSLSEQYRQGICSGRILKKIHSLAAPAATEEWGLRFNQKVERNIKRYLECEFYFPRDNQMLTYLKDNRQLLKGRPQCFQHGDYHTGNMVVSEAGILSVIDFNRWDYGDPWEEFNRIVWSAKVSPHFATGQLHGYFDGTPPHDFFRLLAFYIASNTLSSIPWALSFGQAETEVMLEQSQDVLDWFDGMENPVPNWYFKETL